MHKRRVIPDSAKSRLHYDPASGRITWIRDRKHGRRMAGKEAGSVTDNGYRVIGIDGKTYLAHRVAWFLATGEQPLILDHINGDRKDNRMCNLRSTDYYGNAKNHGRTVSQSGLPCGVRKEPSGRYMARIGVDGKSICLGRYDSVEDAERAYKAARKAHFSAYDRGAA